MADKREPGPVTGESRKFGLTISEWIKAVDGVYIFLQKPGTVSMLFMGACVYLMWTQIPPLAAGHLRYLEESSIRLQELDTTINKTNIILDTFLSKKFPDSEYADRINQDHIRAEIKIDKMAEQVGKIHEVVVNGQ